MLGLVENGLERLVGETGSAVSEGAEVGGRVSVGAAAVVFPETVCGEARVASVTPDVSSVVELSAGVVLVVTLSVTGVTVGTDVEEVYSGGDQDEGCVASVVDSAALSV